MDKYQKLLEAMDIIDRSLDEVLNTDVDSILTEEQMDEEMVESIDKVFDDVNQMMEHWSPEVKAYFTEKIDSVLESIEPELMEEKNIVRLDRNAVFNQLVGLFSLVLARRRKDPAFNVYKKASAMRRKAKNTIKAKYSSRSVPLARRFLKKRRNLRS